jgi:hypothetical protein
MGGILQSAIHASRNWDRLAKQDNSRTVGLVHVAGEM